MLSAQEISTLRSPDMWRVNRMTPGLGLLGKHRDVHRHAPFFIVIANHYFAARPCATHQLAFFSAGSFHKSLNLLARPPCDLLSDFGSDSFFGDFAFSSDTNSFAQAGTPTLCSTMISFALSFLP